MSNLVLNQQSSAPNPPAASQLLLFADNSPVLRSIDPAGNVYLMDNSRNLRAASTATVTTGYASDTYLAGSGIVIPAAGMWKAGTYYQCEFDMTKTPAGVNGIVITVRMGTTGTTSDAAIVTLTFAAGTAAGDTGMFMVYVNFRSVGAGTAAVIQAVGQCSHHLAATGLVSTGASGTGIIINTSSGFNSTTPTTIGLSFNGGGSFSGTNTLVQAILNYL